MSERAEDSGVGMIIIVCFGSILLIKVKLFDNSTRDTGLSFIEYVTGSALVVI